MRQLHTVGLGLLTHARMHTHDRLSMHERLCTHERQRWDLLDSTNAAASIERPTLPQTFPTQPQQRPPHSHSSFPSHTQPQQHLPHSHSSVPHTTIAASYTQPQQRPTHNVSGIPKGLECLCLPDWHAFYSSVQPLGHRDLGGAARQWW